MAWWLGLLLDLLKAGVVGVLLVIFIITLCVAFWQAKYATKRDYETDTFNFIRKKEPGQYFYWRHCGINMEERVTFVSDASDGTVVIHTEDGFKMRIKSDDWVLLDVPVGLQDDVDE